MIAYEWPKIDAKALRQKRAAALVDLMRVKGLDHVLLSGFDNIRYATDYRANFTYESGFDWFAMLVDSQGESVLFTPDTDRDEDDPFVDMPWIGRRIGTPSFQSLWTHVSVYTRLLVGALTRARARRVGIEFLQFEVIEALREALPDVEFVPITWDLLELRKIKMPDEVQLLEAACEVGSISVHSTLERAEVGMLDSDLIAMAISTAYQHGVEWVSHALITAQTTGHDGILSFYARGHEFSEGDAYFIDFGVYGVGGYCHDFCRTGFIGEPPEIVSAAHAALVDAFSEGVEAAKPGVRCSQIAVTINDALRKGGYSPTPYGTGHGIGLRLIELPGVYHRVDLLERDDLLEEGMVICIEPTTEVAVDGAQVKVKEEDQFVVEGSGLRRLTKSRPWLAPS